MASPISESDEVRQFHPAGENLEKKEGGRESANKTLKMIPSDRATLPPT
jgi:hypothetical protein